MSTPITLNLRLEMDGRMLDGFPVVAGLTVDTLHGWRLVQANEPDIYEPLPLETLPADMQILVLRPDDTAKYRIANQTTSNIPIGPRGVLMIWGGVTPMAAVAKIRVDTTTRTDGLVAG